VFIKLGAHRYDLLHRDLTREVSDHDLLFRQQVVHGTPVINFKSQIPNPNPDKPEPKRHLSQSTREDAELNQNPEVLVLTQNMF